MGYKGRRRSGGQVEKHVGSVPKMEERREKLGVTGDLGVCRGNTPLGEHV